MPRFWQSGRKTVQCVLFEKRIASGKQEKVEVAAFGERRRPLPFIDAGADRLDHALVAQGHHRAVARAHELLDASIRCRRAAVGENVEVVHEQNVDPVDAKPLQRGFEGAHHAVMAVVIDLAPRRRVEEFSDPRALVRRADLKQAADLGGEHIVVAGLAAQEGIEPRFGKTEAVERRGVVVSNSAMPRRLQNRLRILFADRAEEIAERRRAEAKLGELQTAIADPVEMPNLHALLFPHLRNLPRHYHACGTAKALRAVGHGFSR